MGLKRLRDAGFFEHSAAITGEAIALDAKSLDKDCLIVYEGQFESMDGPVAITEGDIDRLIENHNSLLSRVKQMVGADEIPIRYYPPLQLDHSTSAVHTIGRVVGPLRKGLHTLVSGETVKAVFGRARVLGQENVEKVADGRWTNLSIGADFEEGTLSELTVTPFPAAGEASMLSKVKGDSMLKKLMAFLTGAKKLTEQDATARLAAMSEDDKKKLAAEAEEDEKRLSNAADTVESLSNAADAVDALSGAADAPDALSKHLMETEKLSKEEADEKLSKMTDEEKKELSAKCAKPDGDGDADDKEKEARLSKRNPKVARLMKDFRAATGEASATLKMAKMQSRISRLRSMAKISPAEIKKVDLKKLSVCSEETIEQVFKSYEDREPVILTGVMGSAKAINLAEINKKIGLSRLEAETRQNMNLKKANGEQVKLSQEEIRENEDLIRAASFEKQPPGYDQIEQLLDKGEVKLAKVALKAALVSGGNVGSDQGGTETQLADLTEKFVKLQKMFEELCELI